MQGLPVVENLEQARKVLNETSDGQELHVGPGDPEVSITKHSDHEYVASLPEMETGIISLRDASHILLEHGDRELQLTNRT
ncbi:hypothetical protein [Rubrobacter indicoceani]|uniref:hypothetical protein n=1 Tax=Rubrobacter indicoceani TaxID=2051957 RepID=UPI000E5AEF9D|nr:hypothetical protein [Rubrobacter indicoceani]